MGGFACSFIKENLRKVSNAQIKTWPNPLKGSWKPSNQERGSSQWGVPKAPPEPCLRDQGFRRTRTETRGLTRRKSSEIGMSDTDVARGEERTWEKRPVATCKKSHSALRHAPAGPAPSTVPRAGSCRSHRSPPQTHPWLTSLLSSLPTFAAIAGHGALFRRQLGGA